MAKFKVGDRVRVLDGSKIEGYTGDWVPKMKKYVGNVYAVTQILPNSAYCAYCLKGILFMFDERGLERVGNPGKIVITTFATGAKLALSRLIDAVNNPPFQVGDIVRVVNTGECDTAAFSWVVRHLTDKSLIARYTCKCDPEDLVGNHEYPSRFRILHIAEGKAFIEKMIEKINDFGFCCYVVGLDGLERMK